MIKYRIDVIAALRERGITYYTCKKNKLLSYDTLKKLENHDTKINLQTLDVLCQLLELEVEDIIEYIED